MSKITSKSLWTRGVLSVAAIWKGDWRYRELFRVQDNDRLIVPPVLSTVGNVGGACDPNSFLYFSRRRVVEHLESAGRPDLIAMPVAGSSLSFEQMSLSQAITLARADRQVRHISQSALGAVAVNVIR